MTDGPILFSAPMIRAIIREIKKPGTGKTETRRIIADDKVLCDIASEQAEDIEMKGWMVWARDDCNLYAADYRRRPGDRLWVREAWKPHSIYDRMPPREMPPSKVFYLADDGCSPSGSRGRPGIHMPRWASRITLIIEDVKVEHLQDISEGAAQREGALVWAESTGWHGWPSIKAFIELWEFVNGPGAWAKDPWVVAIRFRPYLCNIDQMKEAV